jgi:hypothetical protein
MRRAYRTRCNSSRHSSTGCRLCSPRTTGASPTSSSPLTSPFSSFSSFSSFSLSPPPHFPFSVFVTYPPTTFVLMPALWVSLRANRKASTYVPTLSALAYSRDLSAMLCVSTCPSAPRIAILIGRKLRALTRSGSLLRRPGCCSASPPSRPSSSPSWA